MSFSINMMHMVDMAMDTTNGYLNFHILNTLLKAFVQGAGLEHFSIEFSGSDARRIQAVYTGLPDGGETPLENFKVSYSKDDDYNKILRESSVDDENNETLVVNANATAKKTNEIYNTDFDSIRDEGAINLKNLKQIEKTVNGHSAVGIRDEIQSPNNESIKVQSKIVTIMEVLKTLTSKMDKMQAQFKEMQMPVLVDLDASRNESLSMDQPVGKELQKRVRVLSSPSNIFKPRELPFNELLGSEASSVDTLDANDSSNLLDYDNDDDDIEDNKLSMSVMSLSKISYSKPEKYILKNHEPAVLRKHIEKLLARLNKLEYIVQKLIDKYQYPNVTSQILDEHVEMSPKEIDKTKSHQNELDALAVQNSNLKSHPTSDPKSKSNNSDGLSNSKNENEDLQKQSNNELNIELLEEDVRTLHEDTVGKHQLIHELMDKIMEQTTMDRMDIEKFIDKKVENFEFVTFKEEVEKNISEIKNQLANYVIGDSRETEFIHVNRGVTRAPRVQPVMTKTTSEARKTPCMGGLPFRSDLKAHLTYELNEARKLLNRLPRHNVGERAKTTQKPCTNRLARVNDISLTINRMLPKAPPTSSLSIHKSRKTRYE